MGSLNSQPESAFKDWEKVKQENQYEIFKHKQRNQFAEKRIITLDSCHDLDEELKIYHMRSINNESLVRIFAVEQVHGQNSSQMLCLGKKKYSVLTERILLRLQDLPQLTFPVSLLFLKKCLQGYNRILKSYRPIHITKKLIGINDNGEIKCWINQNWAVNHTDDELPTLQSTKLQKRKAYDGIYCDQTEMVHNVVAIIQDKCENGIFPKAFRGQVERHSDSFKKLSTYIEDFIQINDLFIPPKINHKTVFVSKYQQKPGKNQEVKKLINLLTQNNTILPVIQTKSNFTQNSQNIFGRVDDMNKNDALSRINHYKNENSSIFNINDETFFDKNAQNKRQFNDKPSYQPLNKQSNNSNLNFKALMETQKRPSQNSNNYSSLFYHYSKSNPTDSILDQNKNSQILKNSEDRLQIYRSLELKDNSYDISKASQIASTAFQSKNGSNRQNDNFMSQKLNRPTLSTEKQFQIYPSSYTTFQKPSFQQYKNSFDLDKSSTLLNIDNRMHNFKPQIFNNSNHNSAFSFGKSKDLTGNFSIQKQIIQFKSQQSSTHQQNNPSQQFHSKNLSIQVFRHKTMPRNSSLYDQLKNAIKNFP